MQPLVFVTAARAETDIDTIEVYAGISPVLAMNCTDLNFGVWLLPVGTRAGPTYIEIASSGAATAQLTDAAGVADNAVSLSAKFDAPAAGVCTVTGSQVGGAGVTGTATITTGGLAGTLIPGENASAVNYPGAAAIGLGSFTYAIALSTATPAISAEGTAVFMVVGNMMIPAAVMVTHYGAYTGTAGRTISFDDAQSQ